MIPKLAYVPQAVTTRVPSRAAWGRLCLMVLLLTVIPRRTLHAQTKVDVSSLMELREAVQKDDQVIVMKPGRYALTALPETVRNLPISGSNNTIDLSGVYVAVPVGSTRAEYISISGDGNVLRGGTFEDIYKSGLDEVTDFSAYNKDRSSLARGLRGDAVLGVTGNNNTVANTKLTIRGSYPYGYGSIYGIGADNAFGLDKRCGIVIKGEHNTVDGCEIQQRAFGHGIYMQKPADKTVIRNCLVEGAMRPSKDLYLETDPEDLPVRSNYKIQENRTFNEGPPIPKDIMIPLSEDGIRVYTHGGSVTVENCTVKKMRGGIRLYLASGGTVANSIAVDCGLTNFNLPTRAEVTSSTGNFAYAPLVNFRGARSQQVLQLTIVPSPHAVGPHNIADIEGSGHSIVFHRGIGPTDSDLRPIVISDDKSTIRNETEYPITLESSASGNTIISLGPVTDLGDNNTVSRLKKSSGDRGRRDLGKNQYRIWVNPSGEKLHAKFVAKKGTSVTLEKIDGVRMTGRLQDLSKADRTYLANIDKPKIRTWTSNAGSKIEARLIGKQRESVTLEKLNGSHLTVFLKQLSKADRDYVSGL